MLSDSEFNDYVKRLGLPVAGVALLHHIRTGGPNGGPLPPVRRIESRGGNSNVRYSSLKMGFAVECESAWAELITALDLEFDDDVLGYYSQPTRFTLKYDSATGKPVVVEHAPDFIILRTNRVEVRECKTVDGIIKEAVRKPNRYVRVGEGWECPPGKASVGPYGFEYAVWTPKNVPATFARNLRYLDPFAKKSPELYAPSEFAPVLEYVRGHQGVTLAELSVQAGVNGPTLVRWLIAHRHLYCDLQTVALADDEKVRLFTDPALVKAVAYFVAAGDKWPSTFGPPPADMATSPLTFAYLNFGPAAFAEANRRLACIEGRSTESIPERTVRDWKKLYDHAAKLYGNGYLGLLPKLALCGNREPRLPAIVYNVADEVINEFYLDTAGMRPCEVYACFTTRCQDRKLSPPSKNWFLKRINALDPGQVVLARQGPRGAYPYLAGPKGQVGSLDVHGDYPLHVIHIDHTQLDVELRSSLGDVVLGRPWLTVAFDAASRCVLGFYLSFDHPSIDSVVMVLRDLVYRHRVLPIGLTLDNGAEFHSMWFETYTAVNKIVVWYRPPHQARFGALVENFFGVANAQLFHSLAGNTQLTKNVRQLSKSVNPAKHAVWTLPMLHQLIETYVFEHFNQRPHPHLNQSPAAALKSLLAKHGVAVLRRCEFNDEFLISTMVAVKKGTCRVQPGRGVKVHGDYFWNAALASWIRKAVPVRFDLMDAGRVFAFVDGKWVPCHSKYAERIAGLSVREVGFWTKELRRAYPVARGLQGVTMAKLGRFLEETKRREGDLRVQLVRALENRSAMPAPLLVSGAVAPDLSVPASSQLFPSDGDDGELFESAPLPEKPK